ncbi:MAG TPA: TolC family protein, partial [Vicinamibacterales bacterium]|nr:TolC family protein [Vicinamibacterales bacterium]
SPSLDHLPFMGGGADVSLTIEQQIPLSSIRQHRGEAALAGIDRLRADVHRSALDVAVEAANAFVMLHERRRMATLVVEQLQFARDIVTAANARYASATAPQSDVLRAEVEVARLTAVSRSIAGQVRAAEAMLNAAIARDATLPIPDLASPTLSGPVPAWPSIKEHLARRPELIAGRADIARAAADIEVMRDMFRPMATIRTGLSYTMTNGNGWMAMAGITLPIWRDRLRAGVAEAEAMRAMAEADLRAMSRMVEGEAAAAAAALEAARERQRAIVGDVLPRARMAITPAVASYASGQLPLVSVIEAVQALWLVLSELIDADSQAAFAWARLGRAIGSYEAIIP